jgi:hypothetical protein
VCERNHKGNTCIETPVFIMGSVNIFVFLGDDCEEVSIGVHHPVAHLIKRALGQFRRKVEGNVAQLCKMVEVGEEMVVPAGAPTLKRTSLVNHVLKNNDCVQFKPGKAGIPIESAFYVYYSLAVSRYRT